MSAETSKYRKGKATRLLPKLCAASSSHVTAYLLVEWMCQLSNEFPLDL